MGQDVCWRDFTESEYIRFRQRLEQSLVVLAALLDRDGFGQPHTTVGAELELFLADGDAAPAPHNDTVRAAAADDRVGMEVGRYNMELNLTPRPVAGRSLGMMRAEMEDLLRLVSAAASEVDARPVLISILPTLRRRHLRHENMTELNRYQTLERALGHRRTDPFRVGITGQDHCEFWSHSVAVQAACCSCQIHLSVEPAEFVAVHNALQLAIAPVLAAAGNSPLLFGQRLWRETRITLHEQAIGDRDGAAVKPGLRPRIGFGQDWLRHGPVESFEQIVRCHDVMLPNLSEEDPSAALDAGRTPRLAELCLHRGTVWPWHRPVYDPVGSGHLRIEIRPLPAGPTTVDMMANTAFLLGLATHLAHHVADLTPRFPFHYAQQNFYAAAAHGLAARLHWPTEASSGDPTVTSAADLVPRLLPLAVKGLRTLGIDSGESDELLSVMADRTRRGQTGAQWQERTFADLAERMSVEAALRELVVRYIDLSTSGQPVHTWP
ncbi:hypothetical protein [Streptoalloteichus hindustanus]|uniref:Glutamate--cysteine ligase n=1 Tax=Streptoalloteichus hindustanus TaxID=2017 RepID=A0A1M5CXD0_STRHI|nr:hypothetical protein [Streptoalloteichus hindustanus]SHF59403.1 hypothetical protein SAMN05444320_104211 [Streptoalloteichus hindustanus]